MTTDSAWEQAAVAEMSASDSSFRNPWGVPQPPVAASPVLQVGPGLIAETFPQWLINDQGISLVAGVPILTAISLSAGQLISEVGFLTGGVAASLVSHGWNGILDGNGILQAVSADQSAAIPEHSDLVLPVGQYIVPLNGTYWLACSVTADVIGNLAGLTSEADVSMAPVVNGVLPVNSAPPVLGTVFSLPSANAESSVAYGWVA